MAWGYWSTYSHAQTSQVIGSHLSSSRGSRIILNPGTPSGISKRERSLERSDGEDISGGGGGSGGRVGGTAERERRQEKAGQEKAGQDRTAQAWARHDRNGA